MTAHLALNEAVAAAELGSAEALVMALAGGFLLNLTPGLLALFLARGAAIVSEPSQVRRLALGAILGRLLGCAVLIAIALQLTQAQVAATWGLQLQEPVAVTLCLLATVLLALGLWDLLPLPLTAAGLGHGLRAGIGATVLALGWPVPLLTAAVSSALRRGGLVGAALVGAACIGFALPQLALVIAPTLGRRLPATGWASKRSRELLGFVALGGALWLVYLLSRLLPSHRLAFLEGGLLALGLFAWLHSRAKGRGLLRAACAAAIVLAAAGILWLAAGGSAAGPLENERSDQPPVAGRVAEVRMVRMGDRVVKGGPALLPDYESWREGR